MGFVLLLMTCSESGATSPGLNLNFSAHVLPPEARGSFRTITTGTVSPLSSTTTFARIRAVTTSHQQPGHSTPLPPQWRHQPLLHRPSTPTSAKRS